MAASASVASYRFVFSVSPSFTSRFRSPNAFSSSSFLKSTPPSFLGGFISRRPVSERNPILIQDRMIEFGRIAAHRKSDADEGSGLIEREAVLSNVSSEFCQNFVSGGLDTTLNRLSKWLVTAVFGAVILCRHDAESLWAAMGSIVNVLISVTLKRILNQSRPTSTLKSDPGMPSSHAQSIFFAVVFIILSLVEWLGLNEISVIVGTLVLACGSYLSWIRVSQQYHTINQVLVGAVLGSICSILWFWSWDEIVLKAFISLLWVRMVVVIVGSGCCLAFFIYIVRYWLTEEQ
ncbi:lipid phosphate phosphatase epsilon 1, chloroplastic [Macadamia integrifolia]|uniref:lipid phosphate phosphatase epsilon 1, chloroplastic n=1 Tax=Macadamia integrifolia TaxID=60698 RepID=UPI001C4F00B9|nr:lipid phosphate phosphatase epsilon 1, chloroplastic [Macadamia integrifolia]